MRSRGAILAPACARRDEGGYDDDARGRVTRVSDEHAGCVYDAAGTICQIITCGDGSLQRSAVRAYIPAP